MNKLTVLADIASRVTRSTAGTPRAVAAAVVVETDALDVLRHELRHLPKWGKADDVHISRVVDILGDEAVAVAIVSINRDTAAWQQFLSDAKLLHEAIVRESRKAGWANASNLLKFILFSAAWGDAIGHAIGLNRRTEDLGDRGLQLVEVQTFFDNEVEGKENVEVFRSFWSDQHNPKAHFAQLGIGVTAERVTLTTDDAEPALLLPDYAAGLGLAYTLLDQGRRQLPTTRERAHDFLRSMDRRGRVVIKDEDFDYKFDDIFGHAMSMARDESTK